MIDLTKRGLPNVVEINGIPYSIYTDFRVWMRFEIALGKLKKGTSMDVSYLFKNNMPAYCDIGQLLVFSRPQNILPRQMKNNDVISLDYELDSDYIFSAFLGQYGIDLVDIDQLHWHKFLALLKGLRDNEMLCKIMAYRGYDESDARSNVYVDLKRAWEIEKISEEDQTEIDKFSNYFD